ncbi:TatD family hydrolase [Rhodobacter sp. Har01]|uniref:TatD family hydrolase n=1 Tax=Rhodobacter sp. Har01 TaxID=2883999 RepID=UPI001D06D838|nr:TatD family hydrolase [Rhodobacter sp. Har01]MCB6178683.1 TatD family hydrolase [Rhodobacter sp. Har01]
MHPQDTGPLPDIVDSHCHLDFPDFEGELDAIVARARAAGVRRMLTICTRRASLPRVQEIVARYDGLSFAFGIHPMSAAEQAPITVAELVDAAQHPKMVAIGETGLDYHYTPDSATLQQASLRRHIEAAQETGLPLVIHARAADEDMEAILAEGFARAPYACVMHCYSSGQRLAEAALEMGFYLSMSGIAAFPKSQDLRDIFARAPLDRILVETDSPYLAPPPFRGRRNEPAYVVHTARVGAGLFGLGEAEFAAATTANFDRLFTKAARLADAA